MATTPDLLSNLQNPPTSPDPNLSISKDIEPPAESANPQPQAIPIDIGQPGGLAEPELSETPETEIPSEVVAFGFTATVLASFIAGAAVLALNEGVSYLKSKHAQEQAQKQAEKQAQTIVEGMDNETRGKAEALVREINGLGVDEMKAKKSNTPESKQLEQLIDHRASFAMQRLSTLLRNQSSNIGISKGPEAKKASIELANSLQESAFLIKHKGVNIPQTNLRKQAGTSQEAEVAGHEMLNNQEPIDLYDAALAVLGIEAGSTGTDLQVAKALEDIGLSERIPEVIAAGSPVAAELDPSQQSQYANRVASSSTELTRQEQTASEINDMAVEQATATLG